MSRTVTRKFYDRAKGAHELATVYVEDQGRVVKVREAVATKNGMTPMWRPYTEADLADFAGMTVMATCPCGDLYDLDIAARCATGRCPSSMAPAGRGATAVPPALEPPSVTGCAGEYCSAPWSKAALRQ